jgi:hypothetical protein
LERKVSYSSREAEDIANLAFIGGKTNRSISDKPPAEYLPALMEKNGVRLLELQCIPTEPALHSLDRYKEFLAERRRRIAARLNEFLEIGSR